MATVIITKSGKVVLAVGYIGDKGYVVRTLEFPEASAELKAKYVTKVLRQETWDEDVEVRIREKYPECFI